jgi:hypothetical protein
VLVAVVAFALAVSPSANLRITVWPRGAGSPARRTALRCPSAAGACRRLVALPGSPFAPTPPGTVCTQIDGGPAEALVTGTFRGRRVWARFDRHDGCAIARWDRVRFLFGPVESLGS